MPPHSSTLAWKIPWMEEPGRLQSMGSLSWTQLNDFTFTFHFQALEKEMATYSSVLPWRIPGMGDPGGLPSMGSHRVGHDWSDLAAAAHASKVMLKILQPGFNCMWTVNVQMFKLVLDKAEEPDIKLPTSIGSSKKQESPRKKSTSALLTMPKPLTVWITTNCEKFLKWWDARPPNLPPEKSVCRSRSNS